MASFPEDHAKPLSYDPNFKGPLSKRSCTDVLCLLIFIVFLICWIGIGSYAIFYGNLSKLSSPQNSLGARCGLDSGYEKKPFLIFFDLSKCASPTVPITGCPTPQICVEKCPDKNFAFLQERYTSDLATIKSKLICIENIDVNKFRSIEEIAQAIKNDHCISWYLQSTPVFNRCLYNVLPSFQTSQQRNGITTEEMDGLEHLRTVMSWFVLVLQNAISLVSKNPRVEQVGHMIVEDLMSSWWQILVGLAVAMLANLIYILLMRWIAAFMVWLSIGGVIALLSYVIYISSVNYNKLNNNINTNINLNTGLTILDNDINNLLEKKDVWLIFLIASSITLAIILLVIIFLRKRIVIAIALIKEGSKAVGSICSTLMFPIFPWIFQILVVAFTITSAVYLSTIGDQVYQVHYNENSKCYCPPALNYTEKYFCVPKIFSAQCYDSTNRQPCTDAKCSFNGIENPNLISFFQAFNIFGFFWTLFFISALGEMILAATFATWYWTFNKKEVPYFTLTVSTYRTFRYNLGTVAFGSIIITICRIIRLIIEFVEKKLKKYDNEFTKAIFCCCKCFFWCLEKFLKFINRNAYIMCAIHGKNFCTSAKDAFNLLLRNVLRVFVLDKVTDFLFFLGKIFITIGVGCLSYYIFYFHNEDIYIKNLHYNFVPVIVISIGSFFISAIFFGVYAMAVDTLFLCFLEDCERNDGSPERPYYMSKGLMAILGKKNK